MKICKATKDWSNPAFVYNDSHWSRKVPEVQRVTNNLVLKIKYIEAAKQVVSLCNPASQDYNSHIRTRQGH